MSLQVKFAPGTEADAKRTIAWLTASGIDIASTSEELMKCDSFQLELRDTPSVLSYLSQLGEVLSISCITSHGVVFYLTDIPLWINTPEAERRTTSDQVDGFLFCPLSNVTCVNWFGNIYAAHPEK